MWRILVGNNNGLSIIRHIKDQSLEFVKNNFEYLSIDSVYPCGFYIGARLSMPRYICHDIRTLHSKILRIFSHRCASPILVRRRVPRRTEDSLNQLRRVSHVRESVGEGTIYYYRHTSKGRCNYRWTCIARMERLNAIKLYHP